MMKNEVSIFWFRRDLRLEDNVGLHKALSAEFPVVPIFIFDSTILSLLDDQRDARVSFIHQALLKLDEQLRTAESGLQIFHGTPIEVWKMVLTSWNVKAVYCNHDYEPLAMARDEAIHKLLLSRGVEMVTSKDHVIFEKSEVLSDSGTPYRIYTPYKRKWLSSWSPQVIKLLPSGKYMHRFYKCSSKILSLEQIGFKPTRIALPTASVKQGVIRNYDQNRDFPALDATSKLGIHFRFGTVSIREKARKAAELNEVWLSELIWREFFIQIMHHFPEAMTRSFNTRFERIEWRNSEEDFERWCTGTTGYPLVDAGMRELNATGHMHNRVRMVVASFLTKHLLIDWRWGEAYFAKKLLDFELASNNGNWQWCAGTGADAQPYFRIFNPYNQQAKFDKEFAYIRKWVPEFGTPAYPAPMIDHKMAVARTKEAFLVLAQ